MSWPCLLKYCLCSMSLSLSCDPSESFNIAYLAIRGSGTVNGASSLHGQVSRQLFEPRRQFARMRHLHGFQPLQHRNLSRHPVPDMMGYRIASQYSAHVPAP